MPSSRNRKKRSILGSVGRGAVAGAIGGVAMTAAERALLPRLPDRRRPRVVEWDRRVGRLADRAGWEITPRTRTVVGIGTQIAAAAALGAMLGLAEDHLRTSREGRRLLDAAVVYAVSLLSPDLPRAGRISSRLSARRRIGRRVLEPVTPPSIFGRTASLALKALAR
jgi:hypothetical protein